MAMALSSFARYEEVSPDGASPYDVVADKLRVLHESSPSRNVGDLASIAIPTLVLLGENDEVRFEHAVAMYRPLPDGEFCVIPQATNGVIITRPGLVALVIRDLHATSKTSGFAPIRWSP
jgi:pimeloyl-ACP methyl ester carboxylesterase